MIAKGIDLQGDTYISDTRVQSSPSYQSTRIVINKHYGRNFQDQFKFIMSIYILCILSSLTLDISIFVYFKF